MQRINYIIIAAFLVAASLFILPHELAEMVAVFAKIAIILLFMYFLMRIFKKIAGL